MCLWGYALGVLACQAAKIRHCRVPPSYTNTKHQIVNQFQRRRDSATLVCVRKLEFIDWTNIYATKAGNVDEVADN